MMQVVNGIYLPDNDKHFAAQILENPIINGKGTYQYAKISAAIEECPNREQLAIDVGANVGLWTRILACRFDKVVAIEPVPEYRECLRYNIIDTINPVEIVPFAISRWVGNISLKRMEEAATASVSESGDGDVVAQCKPLDDFKFENVGFIKIDVEGYENNVIKSGEFTIRKYRPTIVVEQKGKRTIKYDGYKFAAIGTLADWGMNMAWEMAGDYCMVWR